MGRIRPEISVQIAINRKQSPSKEDPGFEQDFAEACESYSDTAAAKYMPAADVARQQSFGLELFQEYGAVGSPEEFLELTGQTVHEANVQPVRLQWKNPGAFKEFYLIGLRGMAYDQIASMMKVRVNFTDNAVFAENHLRPEQQLVGDQGAFVHRHVYNGTTRAELMRKREAPRDFSALVSNHSLCLLSH